jgi:hypothetical protein
MPKYGEFYWKKEILSRRLVIDIECRNKSYSITNKSQLQTQPRLQEIRQRIGRGKAKGASSRGGIQ